MQRDLEQTIRNIHDIINAIDAKISAVAAYVATLPGATEADVNEVKEILRSRQWTPQTFFGRAPSASSTADTVIGAINSARAARAKGEAPTSS